MTHLQRPNPTRPGFTLIELLVVIAIIGILLTLGVSAAFKVAEGQRSSNTEAAMRTVQKVLEQQWKSVIEKANKENLPASVLSLAEGSVPRARAMWRVFRLRQEFPMNVNEVKFPHGGFISLAADLPPKLTYEKALGGLTGSPEAICSSCLLYALQQNRGGVILEADTISGNIGDSDGDGVKELLDGWKKPLFFFRFPYNCPELDNLNPAPPNSKGQRNRDLLDPEGTFKDKLWNNFVKFNTAGSGVQVFETLGYQVHVTFPPPPPPTAVTYQQASVYMIPTLISSGANELSGLDLNPFNGMAVASPPQADDNIYSFRLRLGMRGD